MSVQILNTVLAWLTVAGQIFVVLLIISLIAQKVFKAKCKVSKFLDKYVYELATLVIFFCVAGSLYYSEIIGYDPCKLCWIQRIFIYPQLVILPIAMYLKDKLARIYLLVLSSFAFVVAGYHYLGQIGFTNLQCDVLGYASSCSERFVLQLGYITIPMMALTAMAIVMILMINSLLQKKSN